MKLETSQDLLLRVLKQHTWSWYRLAKELPAHENTVANWRHGRTIVDKKFAPRLADLLGEPAEYVLACLEADREEDAQLQEVWSRIAEKFRGHVASILLATMLVSGVGTAAKTEAAEPSPVGGVHDTVCYDKSTYRSQVQMSRLRRG
jgi:transcriptional regulator with XRE-family HTH domain